MTESLDRNRILVVDDERQVRDLYFQVLSLNFPDFRVDLAVNGEEAVDAFREGYHGVLIMDVRMPQKDGVTAFKEIEEICGHEGIEMPSFIFCTGFGKLDELKEIIGRADSSHCILDKPVSMEDLNAALEHRLKLSS